ncbi:hypothetical protein ACLOJK_000351 [Asimina triloba]
MAASAASPPTSYALDVRGRDDEKEDFADSKCSFVTVALCPCLVIFIIILIVVSIVLVVKLRVFCHTPFHANARVFCRGLE